MWNLLGFPGTMGYLSFSYLYRNVLAVPGWKWLSVMFVILWAFLMTSVSRVFMKFFISKKEETVLILSTEEEIRGTADVEQNGVTEEDFESEKKADKQKDPYFFGETLLVVTGICLVVIGMVPFYTIEKLADTLDAFFRIANSLGAVTYYNIEGLVAFVVAAVLAVLIYVNLVHGVLLRAIRNKKNKELKEKME